MVELDVRLFELGIKPGILVRGNTAKEIKDRGYFHSGFKDSVLITHKHHKKLNKLEVGELGVLLGYYPKSCENFREIYLDDYILNFNGIKFNTCGFYEEALEWCKKQYSKKIIDVYGKLFYSRAVRTTVDGRMGWRWGKKVWVNE